MDVSSRTIVAQQQLVSAKTFVSIFITSEAQFDKNAYIEDPGQPVVRFGPDLCIAKVSRDIFTMLCCQYKYRLLVIQD